MYQKAAWDTYLKNFRWEDYLDFIAIGLQAIFIPVALCGCCVGCRNRNNLSDRKLKRKNEAKLKKRYEENRALLNMPSGRLIAIQ
jgi:hypothetical protein